MLSSELWLPKTSDEKCIYESKSLGRPLPRDKPPADIQPTHRVALAQAPRRDNVTKP